MYVQRLNNMWAVLMFGALWMLSGCGSSGTASPEFTENSAPIADAGRDRSVSISSTVTLDGRSSSDADGDTLTYRWTIVSMPVESHATLDDTTAVIPSFVADLNGSYVIELIVNDGTLSSAADRVTINSMNLNEAGSYLLHTDITVTVFWAGEPSSGDNGNISNLASSWDGMWMQNYGGVDTPDDRNGYYPAAFIPNENPFYVALPYNDFDENGTKKPDSLNDIPWATTDDDATQSICKNRWIKIIKGSQVAYAQWEDAGPFGEDDISYVFGNALPQNEINNRAGLDVSPALRDYLGLNDIDTVNWQFVDEEDVVDGPWKDVVTTGNVNWIEWYKPDINASWQWQLQGALNTTYDVEIYDIDLFDSSEALIQSLKDEGKKVICYFSGGSYEEWRDDASDFPAEVLGSALDGWAGEKWLDISSEQLLPIMRARLDMAVQKGCNGVEPDNMDGYVNMTGFPLRAEEQLLYNSFMAYEAHQRGLSIGLKNDVDQVSALEPYFDFSVNEECHAYSECDSLQPFIDAGKPVLNAEYDQTYVDNTNGARDAMCSEALNLQFQTLVLPLDLDDSFRYRCE